MTAIEFFDPALAGEPAAYDEAGRCYRHPAAPHNYFHVRPLKPYSGRASHSISMLCWVLGPEGDGYFMADGTPDRDCCDLPGWAKQLAPALIAAHASRSASSPAPARALADG